MNRTIKTKLDKYLNEASIVRGGGIQFESCCGGFPYSRIYSDFNIKTGEKYYYVNLGTSMSMKETTYILRTTDEKEVEKKQKQLMKFLKKAGDTLDKVIFKGMKDLGLELEK